MASTLQDAIVSVRQGDVEGAQRQLAAVIAANPDDVQAWYLLSQIVDSDARRAAYLSKTLALDPYHERAWAEFFSLPIDVVSRLEQGQEPVTVTSGPDIATYTTPLYTEPLYAEPAYKDPAVAATAVAAAMPAVDVETALPDWLRPVAKDQPVVAQRRETPAPKPVEQSQRPPETVQPDTSAAPAQGNTTLSVLLAVLVIATILVLAFLVYLLLQN